MLIVLQTGLAQIMMLFSLYGKTSKVVWNTLFQSYDESYTEKRYRRIDEHSRRYKHENPTGAGVRKGLTGKPWRGIDPASKQRHWIRTPDELDRLDSEGKIYWPEKEGAMAL